MPTGVAVARLASPTMSSMVQYIAIRLFLFFPYNFTDSFSSAKSANELSEVKIMEIDVT